MICLDASVVIAIVNMRSAKPRRRLGDALHAGTPIALPVTAEHLRQEGLSPAFVTYMSGWPGFVVPETVAAE